MVKFSFLIYKNLIADKIAKSVTHPFPKVLMKNLLQLKMTLKNMVNNGKCSRSL